MMVGIEFLAFFGQEIEDGGDIEFLEIDLIEDYRMHLLHYFFAGGCVRTLDFWSGRRRSLGVDRNGRGEEKGGQRERRGKEKVAAHASP